jgi:hypothetical protein
MYVTFSGLPILSIYRNSFLWKKIRLAVKKGLLGSLHDLGCFVIWVVSWLGSFCDGTFSNGSFRDLGPFVTGSFRDGTLCDGPFCDGSFRDGTFCMWIVFSSHVLLIGLAGLAASKIGNFLLFFTQAGMPPTWSYWIHSHVSCPRSREKKSPFWNQRKITDFLKPHISTKIVPLYCIYWFFI